MARSSSPSLMPPRTTECAAGLPRFLSVIYRVFNQSLADEVAMKREAPQKLNPQRTSRREFWDRRTDESAVFWDSGLEFWDSSGTIFARKAKPARKRTEKTAVKLRIFRVGA